MKAEIWESGGLTAEDIRRNCAISDAEMEKNNLLDTHDALNALEPLTTWGLTEDAMRRIATANSSVAMPQTLPEKLVAGRYDTPDMAAVINQLIDYVRAFEKRMESE